MTVEEESRHRRGFDGANLWYGKRGTVVPAIPLPDKKEQPVIEELTEKPEKIDIAERETLKISGIDAKPLDYFYHPEYNVLYGTTRAIDGWKNIIDAYANGTITTTANTLVTVPVKLTNPPNWRLEQWPGAVQLYLVIRAFGIASQFQGVPLTVNIPATAGNLTIASGNGILTNIQVTATGTSNLVFTDAITGLVVFTVLSTATVGQNFSVNIPFNGLVAAKSTTTPVVDVTIQQTSFGMVEVLFIDQFGNVALLGDYQAAGGNQNDIAMLLPTPITDPNNQNVGTLQVQQQPSGTSAMILNWSIGFSAAYMLPASEPKQGARPKTMDIHVKTNHR